MDVGEVVARTITKLEPEADSTAPATLRDVLETLGPLVLAPLTEPDARLDAPAGEPVVLGAGEPVPELTNELVLLAGARDTAGRRVDALADIAAAGGRTVVLKGWGTDLSAAVDTAERLGLTLLITPDETAWRHLDAMVTATRAAKVRVGDDAEPASGDLFALANSIAASLGGPITIEQTSGRVMAYSNLPDQEIDEIRRLAILGRQTPDRPTNAVEYQAVIHGPGPVKFESSDPACADRMAVAVRAGHQILGVIFVLCDRPRLVPDADRVLVDAARATALHLLRIRGEHDTGRTRRGEALRGLFAGTTGVEEAATVLGVPATASVAMITVRPCARPRGPETAEAVLARAVDLVALHGEYWHAAAAVLLEPNSIAVALPVSADGGDTSGDRLAGRLRKLGTDLVTAARRSGGLELAVAIGPVVTLDDAARSLRLSREVADVLESQRVATLDDVRSAVVLAAVRDGRPSDDDALLLPAVGALLRHDQCQGTEYAKTLLVYLGCLGDVAVTARTLNVHENTARYRVKRLGELFGLDLMSGDDTLVAWLQVRTCGLGQTPGDQ